MTMSPKRPYHHTVDVDVDVDVKEEESDRKRKKNNNISNPISGEVSPYSSLNSRDDSNRGSDPPGLSAVGEANLSAQSTSLLQQQQQQLNPFQQAPSQAMMMMMGGGTRSTQPHHQGLAGSLLLNTGRTSAAGMPSAARSTLLEQALQQQQQQGLVAANPAGFAASAYSGRQTAPMLPPSLYALASMPTQGLPWGGLGLQNLGGFQNPGGLSARELLSALEHQQQPSLMDNRRSSVPTTGNSDEFVAGPSLTSGGRTVAAARRSASFSAAATPANTFAGSTNSREPIALGIDEDCNWLSEFHAFVRENFLEVCWAGGQEVALRNSSKKVLLDQVGICCKFCKNAPPGSRSPRSSAYPSSVQQIYQSFTMMLRGTSNCLCIIIWNKV